MKKLIFFLYTWKIHFQNHFCFYSDWESNCKWSQLVSWLLSFGVHSLYRGEKIKPKSDQKPSHIEEYLVKSADFSVFWVHSLYRGEKRRELNKTKTLSHRGVQGYVSWLLSFEFFENKTICHNEQNLSKRIYQFLSKQFCKQIVRKIVLEEIVFVKKIHDEENIHLDGIRLFKRNCWCKRNILRQ